MQLFLLIRKYLAAAISKYKISAVILIAILIMILSFYSGWQAKTIFVDNARVKELEKTVIILTRQADLTALKAAEFEKQLSAAKNLNAQLNEELLNEIKKPDYNCRLPTDGLRLYRKALAAR